MLDKQEVLNIKNLQKQVADYTVDALKEFTGETFKDSFSKTELCVTRIESIAEAALNLLMKDGKNGVDEIVAGALMLIVDIAKEMQDFEDDKE